MAESRHSKRNGPNLFVAMLPAAVPVAGFGLVVTAGVAVGVVGPQTESVAAASSLVALPDNPEDSTIVVSRDFVRTDDGLTEEPRIERAAADEAGTKYVITEANVRTAPNSSSTSVATLRVGTEVTIADETAHGFTMVLHDGAERWIWSEYLADEPPAPPAPARTAPRTTSADVDFKVSNAEGAAAIAIEAALSQIGTPYQWGGRTPGVGFDCSGLTSWAYEQAGISLPRTDAQQAAANPTVSRANLSPGDLVHSPGHVGMYIGGGQMVHAPSSGGHVEVIPLSSRNPTSYTRPW